MALIHILDGQTDEIIGTLNTEKGQVDEPLMTRSIDNFSTFDFKAFAHFDLLTSRNRLLVQDADGFFVEFMIDYTDQYEREKKDVESLGSFIDLQTAKVIPPQKINGATPLVALTTALSGTERLVGNVDYTGNIRTIDIEEHINPFNLIKLIATTFDLEVRYRVEVKGNRIIGRFVDLVEQIAGFEGKEIKFGKDLIGVRRVEDSSNIVTALVVLGPIREDGSRLEVYVEDEEALERWGRSGRHLVRVYEPQSIDVDMTEARLRQLGEEELKKLIDAIVTYYCQAVSLESVLGRSHEAIRYGQTVRIKDDGYVPPLYLKARIRKDTVNVANHDVVDFQIGNYIEYKKEDLEKQVAALRKLMAQKVDGARLKYALDQAEEKLEEYIDENAEKRIPTQPTPPDHTIYKKWVDTSKIPNVMKLFNDVTGLWDEVKGDKGEPGMPGVDGLQGPAGDKGIQGTNGADGKPSYTHIAYANSSDGVLGFSTGDSVNKLYIGMYVDNIAADSNVPSKYKWTLIKGADGSQGTPGAKGSDGKTPYFHVAYATNSTGTAGFSTTISAGKTYIGQYTDFVQADSNTPSMYSWTLIKGDKGDSGDRGLQGLQGPTGTQGIAGPKGTDGLTPYTHIAYADTNTGGGFSQIPGTKPYIGMYTDHTATDSTDPSKYKWSLIKGADGANGTPGTPGADGRTPYFHTAWATNITGTTGFSTTVSVGKTHIGTYTDFLQADSTAPSKYNWSQIKGDTGDKGDIGLRGVDGLQGAKGADGVQGPKGVDGKHSYTHIAYANNSTGTSGFSVSDSTNKLYIGMYVDNIVADSTNPTLYKWTLIKGANGANGTPGTKGADGQTPYFHVAYATNATGTAGFSTTVSAGKTYIGQYTDFVQADSTTPNKYAWTLIKGDKGDSGDRGLQGLQGPNGIQGIAGAKGADGKTPYTHIAYADNASGGGFSQTPINKSYIGMYTDFTATDSTNPSLYKWSLIKGADGAQGIAGPKGTDGQTPYFHTAWANNATGSSGFSTTVSANKLYIGTYTDFTQADSNTPSLYSWTLIKGEKGDTGSTGARGPEGQIGSQGPRGQQGVVGPVGPQGQPTYTWIRYADTANGGGFSNAPAGKKYIGFAFNRLSQTESTNPAEYAWSLIEGPQGPNIVNENTVFGTDWLVANHIKSLVGLNVNDQFIVDNQGNVKFAGDLVGASGTFGFVTVGGVQDGTMRVIDSVGSELFQVSKEGIVDSKGRQILGREGLLTVLTFESSGSEDGWTPSAYHGDYLAAGFSKLASITFNVPQNFKVTSAVLRVRSQPVLLSGSIHGKNGWKHPRILHLYHVTKPWDVYHDLVLSSDRSFGSIYRPGSSTLITTPVWGANWDPWSSPNNHLVQEKGGDITDYVKSGNNTFYIDSLSYLTGEDNIGLLKLAIEVRGYDTSN